jgi:hypothetical protein
VSKPTVSWLVNLDDTELKRMIYSAVKDNDDGYPPCLEIVQSVLAQIDIAALLRIPMKIEGIELEALVFAARLAVELANELDRQIGEAKNADKMKHHTLYSHINPSGN